MSTIVDQLIVTLGLDGSKFKAGAADAENARKRLADQSTRLDSEQSKREKKLADEQAKRAKATEDAAKRMAMSINKVRNEALALFAVFTAGVGLKDFFSSTINNAAALGQQAANLNMSTEALSAWQQASQLAGGTAEGMTAQLKESADAIAKYKLGQGLAAGMDKFFQYGGSDSDLKDGNTYLLARARIIGEMFNQDPNKAHLLAGQMGISEDQFNLIKKGPDAILVMVKAQEKNAAITAKSAAEALKLKQEMQQLAFKLESVATKIALQLAPAITAIAQQITDWLNDPKTDIVGWVNATTSAMGQFMTGVNEAAKSVGGWKNILIGLVAIRTAVFAGEMVVLAASIAKVAASLGLIAKFGGLLKVLGPLALLFHSGGLNENEDAELKRGRAGKPGYDANGDLIGAQTKPSSAGGTRGMRNNNPGNIEYGKFAQANGATGSDGRFAKFPTMEAGQAAMQKLLGGYLNSGSNTVSKAISKWAPSSENNTAAYVAAVAKQLGVGPDQPLNGSHIPALADAISRHENGAAWGARNAMSAVNMPTGAGASARNQSPGGSVSNSTSDVKIGSITVNTSATDAAGVARSIGGELRNNGLIAQANGGVN